MILAKQVSRTWGVVAVVLSILGVVAGCGIMGDVGMKNTITEAEAYRRAEDYVHQAMAALPVQARLEVQQSTSSMSCDDPSDHGPLGRVTVDNAYWVRGLPVESNPHYFDAIADWWATHGFIMLTDERAKGYIWAEKKDDGFRMAFFDNYKGELVITAASPCVWPNGTPAPEGPSIQ